MSCWNRAFALGLAAALSACVAGPNFAPPALDAPSRYTAAPLPQSSAELQPAPATGSASPWWAALNSPRLDEAIGEALQRNR